jgi:hypothetical protein
MASSIPGRADVVPTCETGWGRAFMLHCADGFFSGTVHPKVSMRCMVSCTSASMESVRLKTHCPIQRPVTHDRQFGHSTTLARINCHQHIGWNKHPHDEGTTAMSTKNRWQQGQSASILNPSTCGTHGSFGKIRRGLIAYASRIMPSILRVMPPTSDRSLCT